MTQIVKLEGLGSSFQQIGCVTLGKPKNMVAIICTHDIPHRVFIFIFVLTILKKCKSNMCLH